MNGNQNLDPAALERLMRLGGAAFVCKMIDLFTGYVAEKIGEARRAQASADWAALAKAVHPIKSSAGNVGAVRVQELAQQLEQLCQKGESGPLSALVGELEQAFAAVTPELERKKQSLAG